MPDPTPLDYSRGGDGPAMTWVRRLAVVLACYPPLLLACLYGGWLIAWAHLGHCPDWVWDNPHDAFTRAALMPAEALLVAAWPALFLYLALVGAAFYRFLTPDSPLWRKAGIAGAAIIPWAAAFILLNLDPGDVVKWSGLTPP